MGLSGIIFVTLAFAMSMGFSWLVATTGGPASPYVPYALVSMFFPAIAMIVTRVMTGEKLNIKWARFPLRYVPVALLLIPVATHAVMLATLYAIDGAIHWQAWLTPASDGLYHAPDSRGWGALTEQALIQRVALNALVGVAVVSVFAFFEEVAWRAWFLPRLAMSAGPTTAIFAVAALWALWHVPYALSGIHTVEGTPAERLALIMPVGHLGAGLIIGWLWMKTQSVWLAAIAHGALNNWGQLAFKYMDDVGGHDQTLLIAQNVTLLSLGVLLLALYPVRETFNGEHS